MTRLLCIAAALALLCAPARAQNAAANSYRLNPQTSAPALAGQVGLWANSANSNHVTVHFAGFDIDLITYPVLSGEVSPTNIAYPIGDVRRYGAKCDGTTDDWSPIWNAMQSVNAQASGGTVAFPAATCVVKNTMNLLSHVTLQGQGRGKTVIQYGIASGTTLFSTVNNVSTDHVAIRDLTITGPGTSPQNARAVDLIACSYCVVDKVELNSWTYYGIFLQSSSDVTIHDIWVHDIADASTACIGGTGIHLFYGNTRVNISDFTINNTAGNALWLNAGTTHGNHVANTDITVTNGTVTGFGYNGCGRAGIGADGLQSSTITNVVVDGSASPTTLDNRGIGLFENQGQIPATDNVFSNIVVRNVGTYCLDIRSAAGNRFSNVKCYHPMQAATALSLTAYAVLVEDATVLGPGAGCTPVDCTGVIFDSADNVIEGFTVDSSFAMAADILWGNISANTFRNSLRNLRHVGTSPSHIWVSTGANAPTSGSNGNSVTLNDINVTVDANGNSSYNIGSLTAASGVFEVGVMWALIAYRYSVANAGSGVNDVDYTAAAGDIEIPYTALTAARTITDQCRSTQGTLGNTTISAQFPYSIHVVDTSGSASPTNTISFKGTGSQTVTVRGVTSSAGGSAVIINSPGGEATVKCNGSNWIVVEQSGSGYLQGIAVAATTPTDTQVLQYVNANSDWEPKTVGITINAPTGMGGWGAVNLGGSLSPSWSNESANVVFAGPTTGSAATPTWRSLVIADLPTSIPNANLANSSVTINFASIFSGGGSVALGGTLTQAFVSQAQNLVLASPNGSSGTPSFRALVTGDLPTGIPNANLANSAITINAPTGMSGWGAVSLGGSLSPSWSNENANVVFAGPTSGGAATPTWRSLVAADIPSLSATYCALTACTMTGALTLTFGGGTGTGIAGGTAFSGMSAVNSVTTGETVAQTWTTTASMFGTDGDTVHCFSKFTHAANTNSTTPKWYFNGTAYVSFSDTTSSGILYVKSDIIRETSSTASVCVNFWNAASNTLTTTIDGQCNEVTGLTWSNTFVIKTSVTGATSNSDLTGNFLRCEYSSH